MNKISLAKKLLLLFSVVFFASCDKDFNTIGSDIVGDDNFDLNKFSSEDIAAYDSITGPVQTNNMALNSLGIYNDPAFGVSTSHFVTQVQLPDNDLTFGGHPQIDSVWVYVPYFSKQTSTNADGIRQFELESVYGGDQTFKLKVYENGYYLGSYNPANQNGSQRFYSDDKSKVETNLIGAGPGGTSIPNGAYLNNSSNTAENEAFSFSPAEKIIYKTDGEGWYVDANGVVLADQITLSERVIKERYTPGIWLNLNKEYFQQRFLNASPSNFTNDNIFKEYFRGLYFQVEANMPGQGALAQLDFTKGYIRVTYNTDNVESATPTVARLHKTQTFAFGGNTINFFDSGYSLPDNPQRLQLKGGNGSFATIDLFGKVEDHDTNGNEVPDELDRLREENWLINEASLTFYIDQSELTGMGKDGQFEPYRIYLYDAVNKTAILDYFADGSVNSSNIKENKRFLGGILEKDANGKGYKYKIRITHYIKKLLEDPEATNFKLGLVVTENINYFSNGNLKPPTGEQASRIIPIGSIMNPLGTILHSPESEDVTKKLKLEIYYTKPD